MTVFRRWLRYSAAGTPAQHGCVLDSLADRRIVWSSTRFNRTLMDSGKQAAGRTNDWLGWLNWNDPTHCEWALSWLIDFGVGNLPPTDWSAHDRLEEIVKGWPDWQSCFDADPYSQLEARMQDAYRDFKQTGSS